MDAVGRWDNIHAVDVAPGVVECRLARPAKRNALDASLFTAIAEFFHAVAGNGSIRVVLLSGEGSSFCAGIDLGALHFAQATEKDVGRSALLIRAMGKEWQDALSNLERCGKVVIACMHGACVGAGLELASAADVRVCVEDTAFSMAEVDVGMAADIGGLQRFPKVVGNQSWVRELAFTGRRFGGREAFQFGFVSRVNASREEMLIEATTLATAIASKSPIALFGVKTLLNYTRDHSVDDSLEYAITWNQGMLQSADVPEAAVGRLKKESPVFRPLSSWKTPASKL